MLSWRNVREGDELLRVSEDGRFVVRREAILKAGLYRYRYEVTDCLKNQQKVLETLQAARRTAESWASAPE